MKEIETEQSLTDKLMNDKNLPSNKKEEHKFYGYQIGKINNPSQLSKYDFSDPASQIVLNNAEFYIEHAATCFQEKSLEIFFSKSYTSKQLEDAIKNYTQDGAKHIDQYVPKAKSNVPKFKKAYSLSEEDAYGCCLALSYYTGTQSERISRTCNIIIKLHVKNSSSNIKDTAEYEAMRCIGHWLFRALNCIQLYWGQVTRCVSLQAEQYSFYSPGNIITWLQFSSSSYGAITPYFAVRNTRFIIYSLSGRCIEQYSNYTNAITESQVLFKPFSHFMVFKRKTEGSIEYIYMRQIFIGQSKRNVLWVDDHIFEKNWENKLIMERAIVKDPLLNIIPKVSTDCALAFLRSRIGQQRKASQFRIMTDMTRNNEEPSDNAGGRFLRSCQEMQLKNKKMIFTSNKEKAEKILKQLGVRMQDLNVSIQTVQALAFLSFN